MLDGLDLNDRTMVVGTLVLLEHLCERFFLEWVNSPNIHVDLIALRTEIKNHIKSVELINASYEKQSIYVSNLLGIVDAFFDRYIEVEN